MNEKKFTPTKKRANICEFLQLRFGVNEKKGEFPFGVPLQKLSTPAQIWKVIWKAQSGQRLLALLDKKKKAFCRRLKNTTLTN